MSSSSQNPERDGYIAGLRELADWLEQHPSLRLPSEERMLLPLMTNEAVEEFAAAHGLSVVVNDGGNASVDIPFGPITYRIYGYADWDQFRVQHEEKQARTWADKNGMVIEPREGGAA